MKRPLDIDKIAGGLGAERRGKVSAKGGYFGAMQLLADVEAMQLAALLLEKTTRQLSEAEAEKLVRPRHRSASARRA